MEVFFLFPFIFFILTVVVMLWIIKKKFAASIGSEKLPEWKSALGEVLSRLREQAQTGKGKDTAEREKDKKRSSAMEVVWEKGMGFDTPPPLPSKRPERRKRQPVETQPTSPIQQKAPPAREPFQSQKITAHKLREAVIWSEILAPPVALRRDEEM